MKGITRKKCTLSLHSLYRRLKKKSELLVNFWSTSSVGDFGWGTSDGTVIGQESSEGLS